MSSTENKIDWKKIELKNLAGLISETLQKDGIETILVGGACVAIYSENRYVSYDLDYITYEDKDKVKKSLEKLGFREKNKHFSHPDCPFLIEFVSPPIAVGKEMVRKFENLKTKYGTVKLLRDVDCVKDRLASFYHWNDKQGLIQAIEVCLDRKIDFEELQKWSNEEGFQEKYALFLETYNKHLKENL